MGNAQLVLHYDKPEQHPHYCGRNPSIHLLRLPAIAYAQVFQILELLHSRFSLTKENNIKQATLPEKGK